MCQSEEEEEEGGGLYDAHDAGRGLQATNPARAGAEHGAGVSNLS